MELAVSGPIGYCIFLSIMFGYSFVFLLLLKTEILLDISITSIVEYQYWVYKIRLFLPKRSSIYYIAMFWGCDYVQMFSTRVAHIVVSSRTVKI